MRDTPDPAVLNVDLSVIGAGSGGLVVAAGASQMGASVALIEAGRMGGDCLNYGCVPSKALLAAAHRAQDVRTAGRFGIRAAPPDIAFEAVMDHVRASIAAIAPHDSVERFTGLGVKVIQARATFTGPRSIEAGAITVHARRFVIAAGSHPLIPPIAGLDRIAYFTNETIFENRILPRHLVIVGGGPIGIEMAQAFRRLGALVTVVQRGDILPKDDPELANIVRRRLSGEGVVFHEQAVVEAVEPAADGLDLMCRGEGEPFRVSGSHLLIAAGRRPSIEGLGLERAGVAHDAGGITVDRSLRTSNRRIYAVGDVVGGPQFTHMAGHHAGIVLRNALFRLPATVETRAVPWVTYSDPELAQVGLTEAAARAEGRPIRILRFAMAENNRALTERDTDGLIKVITTPGGHILGAGIVGAGAGELLLPWILAIRQKLKIGALAGLIAPYPTRGDISKSVAGSFFAQALFGPRTRWLVRFLARLGS